MLTSLSISASQSASSWRFRSQTMAIAIASAIVSNMTTDMVAQQPSNALEAMKRRNVWLAAIQNVELLPPYCMPACKLRKELINQVLLDPINV